MSSGSSRAFGLWRQRDKRWNSSSDPWRLCDVLHGSNVSKLLVLHRKAGRVTAPTLQGFKNEDRTLVVCSQSQSFNSTEVTSSLCANTNFFHERNGLIHLSSSLIAVKTKVQYINSLCRPSALA